MIDFILSLPLYGIIAFIINDLSFFALTLVVFCNNKLKIKHEIQLLILQIHIASIGFIADVFIMKYLSNYKHILIGVVTMISLFLISHENIFFVDD